MTNRPVSEPACRRTVLSAKFLAGEMACRQTVLSAKCPIGELSCRRTVCPCTGYVREYDTHQKQTPDCPADVRTVQKELQWKLFSIKTLRNRPKTKSVWGYISSIPGAHRRGIFYTNQLTALTKCMPFGRIRTLCIYITLVRLLSFSVSHRAHTL